MVGSPRLLSYKYRWALMEGQGGENVVEVGPQLCTHGKESREPPHGSNAMKKKGKSGQPIGEQPEKGQLRAVSGSYRPDAAGKVPPILDRQKKGANAV